MTNPPVSNQIILKGARSNNLKGIDLTIPKHKLVVVTGLSGSGKSSLIIDTLYAEGQRRYVESLSSYARQFLHRMKKPDVDYIKGLCPAIAIEQKVSSSNARSTVGSMTEIYDFIRLLFAKIGRTYSPISGNEVVKHSISHIVDFISELPKGTKVYLGFSLKFQKNPRPAKQELEFLLQKGFTRIWLDGKMLDIQDCIESPDQASISNLFKSESKSLILVDRFLMDEVDEDFMKRLADSVQTALAEGHGHCKVIIDESEIKEYNTKLELDGLEFAEPTAALFNYNNSFGACPKCEGYGRIMGLDENKVIPNPSKSVYDGAIACWNEERAKEWLSPLINSKSKFPIHRPYRDLTTSEKEILWEGQGDYKGIRAFFKELEQQTYKIQNRIMIARYRGRTSCDSCKGGRLRPEAYYVRVKGKSFREMMFVPIDELLEFFKEIQLDEQEQQIADRILEEIKSRLQILCTMGLSYLMLDRLAGSLSGGESQRIHLTRTLGSNLCESLYILDEPSIGLHPKDTARLIEVLFKLRDLKNTVIVIEHEEEVIRQADYIIDIGPGAGIHGGYLNYSGNYSDFISEGLDNLTAAYLTGFKKIEKPLYKRPQRDYLILNGAQLHNLCQLDVKFPLNNLICVTGVSGSGKTTLVKHMLYPLLQQILEDAIPEDALLGASLNGPVNLLSQVEMVSQQGIGRSSRSNPATYVKAYDDIREIYKNQQLSRIRGYLPKHFSFNVEGGRCEACKGDGHVIVEMQFLADVTLLCEDCGGKRFKNEILEVYYKEKNIFDVLELSIEEALNFFHDKKDIVKKLKPLYDVGLGYLKLGQSSSTLSGGEAQRLKLGYYLGLEDSSQKIFFIFDEPTTGLHFDDIRKLLHALHGLVEKGHTVLVIEHNMEVIKTCDWLIDLGPDGGKAGGRLLYEGIPEGILKVKESHTGHFLKEKLI
ncbi:MAG: excinuclease ABC subunit UvrA [Saprospiraceae bacterium]|nr:excinuclease ABC subunit UvrA [Saprospiraceae bacterium]